MYAFPEAGPYARAVADYGATDLAAPAAMDAEIKNPVKPVHHLRKALFQTHGKEPRAIDALHQLLETSAEYATGHHWSLIATSMSFSEILGPLDSANSKIIKKKYKGRPSSCGAKFCRVQNTSLSGGMHGMNHQSCCTSLQQRVASVGAGPARGLWLCARLLVVHAHAFPESAR